MFVNLFFLIKTNKYKIVHCRSYVTAIIAVFLKSFFNFKLIFDMRGFWIDERIEWKIWKNKNLKYYLFRKLEKELFKKSNIIITLTNDAKQYIVERKNVLTEKIFVIPTCVNLKLFTRNKKSFKKLTLIHLCAIGTRYNFEKFISLYKKLNNFVDLQMLIINKNEKEYIKSMLKKNNIKEQEYNILSVDYKDVGDSLLGNSVGVFFPINGFYLKGYFPTKLAEFLSAGIPVITHNINTHVNDIIKNNNVGISLQNKSILMSEEMVNINALINNISEYADKCTNVAQTYFSSKKGSDIYDKIYTKLNL